MTELDFDELDKAVNDLMQENDSRHSSGSSTVAPVAPVPMHVDAPAATPPVPAETTGSLPVATASEGSSDSPLAVRRRGKFMDVMSSANKKPSTMSAPVSRQGITIAAPGTESSVQPADAPKDKSVVSTEDTQPEPSMSAEKVDDQETQLDDTDDAYRTSNEKNESGYAAHPAPAMEWPEPKEVTELTDTTDQADAQAPNQAADDMASEPDAVQNQTTGQHADDESVVGSAQEPGDANVTAPTVTMPEPSITPAEVAAAPAPDVAAGSLATVVMPDIQKDANGAETPMASPFIPDAKVDKRPLGGGDQPDSENASTSMPQNGQDPTLPREYGSDIMNLESSDTVTDAAEAPVAPQPATPAAALQPVTAQNSAVETPTQQNTVAKQPTEGGIYDTDTYHAPLKDTAKPKSGLHAVLWILIVLIVGAMIGAAYFFMTMHR